MDYINLYIIFLKKFLKPKRPVKIVFDSSNGTTGIILRKLFQGSNVNGQMSVVFLNDKPDGNFPAHGPNPLLKGATRQLEKEVMKLRRWDGAPTAKRVGADLGIIFDGDGDRVFFVDNLGRWIDANEIGYILMQNFKPPYVVGAVSSWRLKNIRSCDDLNISRTGHYFFKKLMRKKMANLGVEHSGHYYFKDFFYCDAGIFAAIVVLNFVSQLRGSLSDWLDELPGYYRSGEINFSAKGGPASGWEEKMMKRIEKKYKKDAKKILKMDGLTMEFQNSAEFWFNLRPSNTEDLLRLNMEATNEEVLKEKLRELKKILKN